METVGHCLRCNQTFVGEFCPRCDTDRLPADQQAAGPNATELVVHYLYAEARAGLDPQAPIPPNLTITAMSSLGPRVVVRTEQAGRIDRFRVAGGQVRTYGSVPDPDKSLALARLLLRGRI